MERNYFTLEAAELDRLAVLSGPSGRYARAELSRRESVARSMRPVAREGPAKPNPATGASIPAERAAAREADRKARVEATIAKGARKPTVKRPVSLTKAGKRVADRRKAEAQDFKTRVKQATKSKIDHSDAVQEFGARVERAKDSTAIAHRREREREAFEAGVKRTLRSGRRRRATGAR